MHAHAHARAHALRYEWIATQCFAKERRRTVRVAAKVGPPTRPRPGVTLAHIDSYVFFVTIFVYSQTFEACFDPRECLESLWGVGEINFAALDAPNGLTATPFSKKT